MSKSQFRSKFTWKSLASVPSTLQFYVRKNKVGTKEGRESGNKNLWFVDFYISNAWNFPREKNQSLQQNHLITENTKKRQSTIFDLDDDDSFLLLLEDNALDNILEALTYFGPERCLWDKGWSSNNEILGTETKVLHMGESIMPEQIIDPVAKQATLRYVGLKSELMELLSTVSPRVNKRDSSMPFQNIVNEPREKPQLILRKKVKKRNSLINIKSKGSITEMKEIKKPASSMPPKEKQPRSRFAVHYSSFIIRSYNDILMQSIFRMPPFFDVRIQLWKLDSVTFFEIQTYNSEIQKPIDVEEKTLSIRIFGSISDKSNSANSLRGSYSSSHSKGSEESTEVSDLKDGNTANLRFFTEANISVKWVPKFIIRFVMEKRFVRFVNVKMPVKFKHWKMGTYAIKR